MNIPANLKYTKDHEWVSINGNVATVGITDFAQHELGDIVYVDIKSEGEQLAQEEIFGTVEAVKTVSDLFMPLSGKVIEINKGLDTTPDAVNNDAYETGWMIKIELSNDAEIAELLDSTAYTALIGA
ncbi:MAG: glycine cleavage system protein GcvH [Bacteroidia bacterium]|nr:glycine cleavage system protein GcvH [Bacteroidia bacterium]